MGWMTLLAWQGICTRIRPRDNMDACITWTLAHGHIITWMHALESSVGKASSNAQVGYNNDVDVL
eukprot:scaffold160075_cov18-Tisochrysis_lutea.AAC.1